MKIRILSATALLIMLSGCTTVQEGMLGNTRANVEPFAKETINALGVDTIDFRESKLVYLRDLIEEDAPEIIRLRELLAENSDFRRELIIYSLELVRVTDMNSTEEAQIAALADAVSKQLRESYIEELNQQAEKFDTMIANIRAQEEFLEAVKAVEPIIHITSDYHTAVLSEIEDEALPEARKMIHRRIDTKYGVFLEHSAYMADRKDQILIEMLLVSAARLGDGGALQELRTSAVILSSARLPTANVGEDDFDRAEQYLMKELEQYGTIANLLAQDRADYLATRAELEREVEKISGGLRSSRMRVNAWLQAHEALANGVTNPGKWLSIALSVASTANKAL
jgi:hypothetical protein